MIGVELFMIRSVLRRVAVPIMWYCALQKSESVEGSHSLVAPYDSVYHVVLRCAEV